MGREIARIIRAGGKRLRPVFCYWGFRACGGSDGPEIIRAAASLEFLHTMMLIHDDVVDETPERRGVPAVHRSLEDAAAAGANGPRAGRAAAIVTGDLAAVVADRLLIGSGFPPSLAAASLARSYRMRVETAAGAFIDVLGERACAEEERAELGGALDPIARAAIAKGGAYTVEGPLLMGATLAGADAGAQADTLTVLSDYGRSLGAAFQLLDDLADGDAPTTVGAEEIDQLVHLAVRALERAGSLDQEALGALRDLVAMIAGAS